jgi:hypothetical protein
MSTNGNRAAARHAEAASAVRRPVTPSRIRFDADRIVGLACVFVLPIALWLAQGGM